MKEVYVVCIPQYHKLTKGGGNYFLPVYTNFKRARRDYPNAPIQLAEFEVHQTEEQRPDAQSTPGASTNRE